MRLLLTNPSETIGEAIELSLKARGYVVEVIADLGDAIAYARDAECDAIVLELEPGDGKPLSEIHASRREGMKTPVVIVSAGGVRDACEALTVADDYVRTPFHSDELAARVQAVVRRSKGHSSHVIEIEGLKLELDAGRAWVNGSSVKLTRSEFRVLETLVLRQGTIVTKETILDCLYNGLDEAELKIVDVFICKVRKKLAAAGWPVAENLLTVWGRGWTIRKTKAVAA